MKRDELGARIERLTELGASRRISRRQLIRRATALGLGAPVIASMIAACADGDTTEPGAEEGGPTAPPADETSSNGDPQPAGEQTLIYPWANEARSLDPGNAAEAGSLDVVGNCYEPLVSMVPRSTDIEPRLATDWDVSDDADVYTFYLREGVNFVDGTLMDAAAVKRSFERTMEMGLGPATPLEIVGEIEEVDQFTVRFHLESPDAYFVENLTQQYIIAPSFEDHDSDGDLGANWLETGNTLGTGPFNLTDFRKDETKTMERFADYWRGWEEPRLQRMICPIVPEELTRRQMIERGDSHFSRLWSPDHAQALQESPAAVVEFLESYFFWTKPMNMLKSPTENLKLRQAIQYAFPYQEFADTAWLGWAQIPNGPIPVGFPGYDPDLPPFQQDLDMARQLVEELKEETGMTEIVLDSMYTETLAVQGTMETTLQEILRSIGVELQVRAVPWATMFDSMSNPDDAPNMSNVIIGPTRPDPAFALEWMFGSELFGQPYNWSYYENDEVDALIEQARSTVDREESEGYLREASHIIIESAPVLWYGLPERVDGYSAKVQNFTPITVGFLGETKWYDVWLSE